jgi:hypothetical protein
VCLVGSVRPPAKQSAHYRSPRRQARRGQAAPGAGDARTRGGASGVEGGTGRAAMGREPPALLHPRILETYACVLPLRAACVDGSEMTQTRSSPRPAATFSTSSPARQRPLRCVGEQGARGVRRPRGGGVRQRRLPRQRRGRPRARSHAGRSSSRDRYWREPAVQELMLALAGFGNRAQALVE